jgi:CBS-domain-containing membrane protein
MKPDALEAITNATIGYLVSVAATYWLLPLWGYSPPLAASFGISAMFFAVSTARSYALRRIFRSFE